MSALPLAFLAPWMLAALIALPALWLLLRLTPPKPRRVDFPPLRLLLDVVAKRETPARTPWWLLLLRLGLAALLIFALAKPILNPPPAASAGSGPLLLVIDNGWAAASEWDARVAAAQGALEAAGDAGRPVALVATADPPREIGLGTAEAAVERLRVLAPEPFASDRAPLLAPVEAFLKTNPTADAIWIADGLAGGDARAFAEGLKAALGSRALAIRVDRTGSARALVAAENTPGAMTVKALRAEAAGVEPFRVRASDLRGRPLAEVDAAFPVGARETTASFDLPVELRNDIARLEIVGAKTAGAVQLLDQRSRRRSVGLVTGATADVAQPLLSPTYYVAKALKPFADVREARGEGASQAVERFVADKLPVIVLADVGALTREAHDRLSQWVRNGGVLIRFAGPRLAGAPQDDLSPVRLRQGGRILGGALAWETPQPLASYAAESPFAPLVPPKDVTVTRQVLAEPDADLPDRVWATLGDGTPLVTGVRQDKGLSVLFHVTADTRWSNLPLSGAFVDMLRRIVDLAGSNPPAKPEGEAAGAATTAAGQPARGEAAAPPSAASRPQTLPPTRTLDGFGAFRSPPATAKPAPADGRPAATRENPPGFYGPVDAGIAVNLLPADAGLARLDLSGLDDAPLVAVEPTPVAPWLLTAAALLAILDSLVVFLLAGGAALIGRRRPQAAALLLAGVCLALAAAPSLAQTPASPATQKQPYDERFALEATLSTRLAYVATGDSEIDRISKAGLEGLTQTLAERTALEPGAPMAVDPAKDELSFFPLIYWPVTDRAAPLPPETLARVDAYMKQGGTILFDTRDALTSGAGGPQGAALRRLLDGLDVPALEKAPKDHVLTKAFYLLDDFPGRYAGTPLWVEALPPADEGEDRPARAGDGVSPILITAADFAGAWAVGSDGMPLFPTSSDERQREMAYRVGVNIVMYTLTGNYKADQVHVPALLERLGQ
ncbi:MAG: LytTR family transcriptional regulator [Ancylobacter novellus]|uniref:LytTR family transcriptional regulator n=1 Tax=Ancylobacter novellus TaxID=921 RepID=A0A2W5KPS7_ANCNO|nr:MAG: LytTR family transcriptional regulator [Ancylobacter novellus]